MTSWLEHPGGPLDQLVEELRGHRLAGDQRPQVYGSEQTLDRVARVSRMASVDRSADIGTYPAADRSTSLSSVRPCSVNEVEDPALVLSDHEQFDSARRRDVQNDQDSFVGGALPRRRRLSMAGSHDIDGALAEFAALRQEIDDRAKAQHQILTLQLTAVAAVFGVVVSRPNMTPLLLGLPVISYLFCSRLVSQHRAALVAAQYIREELSPRIPGGLGWEEWIQKDGRRSRLEEPVLPLLLTFPATGVAALMWSGWFVFTTDYASAIAPAGFAIASLVGIAVTVLSVMLVAQNPRWKSRV